MWIKTTMGYANLDRAENICKNNGSIWKIYFNDASAEVVDEEEITRMISYIESTLI